MSTPRRFALALLAGLLLHCVPASLGNDEISSHIRKCCIGGLRHARTYNNCANYEYEVAAIPPLWRGLCSSTYGVCCSRETEKQHCTAGRLAAQRGSRCSEQYNTTAYADCCRSCQVGLAVRASENDCNDALFSYFADIESYRLCCAVAEETTAVATGGVAAARDPVAATGVDDDDDDVDEAAVDADADVEDDADEDKVSNNNTSDGTIVLNEDDDDICGKVPNLCAQICENTKEAYRCRCNPGYRLDDNNVTCSPLADKKPAAAASSPDKAKRPAAADDADDLTDEDVDVDADEEDEDDEAGADGESVAPLCPSGYEHDFVRRKCVDIDECTMQLDSCKASQYCHNTVGSYHCLNVKSKTCEPGHRFATKTERCEDINECLEGTDNCVTGQQCLNTKGGFKCQSKGVGLADLQVCPSGYIYSALTEQCEDYDECGDAPCESGYTCVNHPGRYACAKLGAAHLSKLAAGGGPGDKCGDGFQQQHGRCVDIDECATDKRACDSTQECTNDIGGYHCDCRNGFNLDTTTNACVDINECSINNHNCLPTQRCDNTVGSYICTRLQSCGTGYTLNAETGNCDDDDECGLGTHNCPPDYECYNTKGSFRCHRRPPPTTTTTTTSTTTTTTTTTPPPPPPVPPQSSSSSYGGGYPHYHRNRTQSLAGGYHPPSYASHQTNSRASMRDYAPKYVGGGDTAPLPCDTGFQRNHLGACVDVNECLVSSPCGSHQRCINTNGSYRCHNLLQCAAGYKSTPDGTTCVDIDECETGEHNCADNQICRNRNGAYVCSCPPGHQLKRLTASLSRCVDINECEQEHPPVCPSNAQCLNTIGSYYCECKSGYQKSRDNDRICLDVDECQEIAGLCQQKCVNFWGGYRCTCNAGYELSADNRTCNDVDECEVHKAYKPCMGFCNNVPGSYECSCPRGYTLAMDKNTCRDIDECATGDYCTGRNDVCTNKRGSYLCTTIQCPYGYTNDPDQKNRCRLTSNQCEGDECYNKPSAYTYHFITLISKLMIPPEGRVIFSLRGPVWYDDIDFDLKIVKIQADANIEKASDNHFNTIKGKHEVHLSLRRALEGPQDIELELSMTVFTNGMPRGKSVTKIFILVSQYTF